MFHVAYTKKRSPLKRMLGYEDLSKVVYDSKVSPSRPPIRGQWPD